MPDRTVTKRLTIELVDESIDYKGTNNSEIIVNEETHGVTEPMRASRKLTTKSAESIYALMRAAVLENL
jgi:hypothetical protein